MNMNYNPLAQRAMLASLKVGAWRANKLHRDETQAENQRHNVNDIARVMVKLTDHAALIALGKLHAAARQAFYRLSLPSTDDGTRLMPLARQPENDAEMLRCHNEHDKLTREFLADYDAIQADAPQRLNGLYRAEFFPPSDVVADKFRFECRYLPVPVEGTWQDWIRESGQIAEGELRGRFRDALLHLEHKLANKPCPCSQCNGKAGKTGNFKDTLVGNLRDLCELAGDLNLTQANDITRAVDMALADLTHVSPESLRENDSEKARVISRAAEISSILKI